jgi:hypothetical protein
MSEEAIKELSKMLVELKLSTERMASRLEQTCDSIERLEASLVKVDNAVSSQERRLIILEQSIPSNLLTDFNTLKNSYHTQQKIIWAMSAGLLGTWGKALFSLIH